MGTTAPAQRVLLGEDWRHCRIFFARAHHRCLGSERALPYSADRGKKSVNRQALDELKQQIPLMGYLQAHGWYPARRLSRGRWMGLCPLHADHKPSFLVDPHKDLFWEFWLLSGRKGLRGGRKRAVFWRNAQADACGSKEV